MLQCRLLPLLLTARLHISACFAYVSVVHYEYSVDHFGYFFRLIAIICCYTDEAAGSQAAGGQAGGAGTGKPLWRVVELPTLEQVRVCDHLVYVVFCCESHQRMSLRYDARRIASDGFVFPLKMLLPRKKNPPELV
jgi:hypothetical protein